MQNEARCVISHDDPLYPHMLLDLPGEPPRLFVRGAAEILSMPSIAVVGSRRATPYGLAVAELAARLASEAGIAVVSGGAIGCDQAAGRSAVASGGRHIMVLGGGADVVYPKSSERLIQDAIEGGGAIVSLEPWGAPPRRYAFPKRNRIIAALARSTIVCEAGMPSGTFSTAETASDLGREVLAVPGSMFSPEFRGTNYLISIGATCVIDEESLEVAISRIYETLRYSPGPVRSQQAQGTAGRIMDILVAQPSRCEEVARHIAISEREALLLLSQLAVEGLVEQLYDGRFAASKKALHGLTSFGTMKYGTDD